MRLPDVCCNCSCKESQSLTALSVSIRLHLSMNPDAILSDFTQLVVQLFSSDKCFEIRSSVGQL